MEARTARARRERPSGSIFYHSHVSRARVAFFVFAAGTVPGLYFGIQAVFNPAIQPPLTWWQALSINFTYYYLWALTTPIVVALARRFRFESGRWPIALVMHTLGSVLLTALQIVMGEAVLTAMGIR